MFMRLGIKSVTMDDLARELGVSKKTLYKHVVDKRDLVEQCLQCKIQEHQAVLSAVAQSDGNAIDRHFVLLRHIRQMMQETHPSVLFDLEKYYPEVFRMMMEARGQMIRETMGRNLQRGQEEGLYREDCDPFLVTQFLIAVTGAIFQPEVMSATNRSFSDLQVDAFLYHIRGISSDAGRQYLEQKFQSEDFS